MLRRLGVSLLICFGCITPGSARVSFPFRTTTSWLQGWPMVGHDPQRTDRSPIAGPLHPQLLSTFGPAIASTIVGSDGTIYTWGDAGLIALNASGHPVWRYHAYLLDGGPPALAPDGRLLANGFVSDETSVAKSAVLAVKPGGGLAWKIQPAAFSKDAPPLVASNGVVYVPFVGPTEVNSSLAVVNPHGKAQFLQHGFSFFAVALGKDRSIYAIGRYPSHQGSLSIERLSSSGKRLWTHSLGLSGLGLLVGSRGNVYVTDGDDVGSDNGTHGKIVAYDSQGRRLWRVKTSDGRSTLAEIQDGSILAAGQLGMTAVSPSGKVLWHLPLGRSERDAIPSIAVDAAGTMYVGSGDGMVRTISQDGRLLGSLAVGPPSTVSAPEVAIGADGRLIITATDGTVKIYG